MDAAAVQSWQKQPEQKAVVWQHNRLAEARYELTARKQKLLLYVIAMIEPEDEDFTVYHQHWRVVFHHRILRVRVNGPLPPSG